MQIYINDEALKLLDEKKKEFQQLYPEIEVNFSHVVIYLCKNTKVIPDA